MDLSVGTHEARLHVKFYFQFRSFCPRACKIGIAFLHFIRCKLLSVQAQCVVLCPSRNSQRQCDLTVCICLNLEMNSAILRIRSCLSNVQDAVTHLYFRIACNIQVYIYSIFCCCINIIPQTTNQSGNVRRAACACEPFLSFRFYMMTLCVVIAYFRHRFQRIYRRICFLHNSYRQVLYYKVPVRSHHHKWNLSLS